MRPRTTIATFLAVACAALTACTSSAGTPGPTFTAPHTTVPVSTPPSTTGTSRTSTPPPSKPTIPADVPRTGPNTRKGEQPPVMPIDATKHSPDGAKAFAEFFIKTIDWGYATTSSAYMRHYFSQCTGCSAFAKTIDEDAAHRYRYIGGRLSIRTVDSIRVPHKTRCVIVVDGTARAVVDRHGNVVHAYPAYPDLKFGVTLSWTNNLWQTSDLGVVA